MNNSIGLATFLLFIPAAVPAYLSFVNGVIYKKKNDGLVITFVGIITSLSSDFVSD